MKNKNYFGSGITSMKALVGNLIKMFQINLISTLDKAFLTMTTFKNTYVHLVSGF